MREIYLDNAATTQTYPEVDAVMGKIIQTAYANPASLHKGGMDAERYIKTARTELARVLGCGADEIYFTSGGTESDNLAILGFANANRKRGTHIITTSVEHPAVFETVKHLEECGFEADYLRACANGCISLDELEDKLREDTILVSVMHVNNEAGSIMPVERIKSIMQAKSPRAALHIDAIQSFGKLPVMPAKWGADLLSISGHKIHGPKGVGALYVKKGTIIKPVMFGGGHQKGLRPGTENVAGIAGLGVAANIAVAGMDKNYERVSGLRNRLLCGIQENIAEVSVNGEGGSPYILNVSFLGVRSEILLHALESACGGEVGIYVSSGSACSSNKPQPSKTLTAMGKSKEEIDSALRFSISEWNNEEEMDICVEVLKATVADIRRYTVRR